MAGSETHTSFRTMLSGERFYYGAELVTTRGIADAQEGSKLLSLGEALAGDPRIGWISVTDNPGGNPMLPADWLGRMLARKQAEVVVHLTCKDLNRNGIESAAWRLAAEGFHNVLALTGDAPAAGYNGTARGVFDLDSAALVLLLSQMNAGLQTPGRKGDTVTLAPTQFFIGCAVSPFKRHERELMPQYFKLARKVRAGAEWVIPQLGYDMRKFQEVKLFLEWANLSRPIIGNVYLLSGPVAKIFNANKIPGCVVSDGLRDVCEKQAASPDKGAKFFQELAAKQLAVFKGMGFAAGYLAGSAKAETFFRIIDMAESFGASDWKEFAKEIQFARPDEFYLFEKDPVTGVGTPGMLNAAYVESLKYPVKTPRVTFGYRASKALHRAAFTPGKGLFGVGKRLYEKLEKKPQGLLSRSLHSIELTSKAWAYGCRDCGDCSLPECAFQCPRKSCSKCGRNGPCGGSNDGMCELGDKECIWAKAYDRLKYDGSSQTMLDGVPVFVDASLEGTSAWANAFLERDHNAKKQQG
jgi:methylenetetrahydrofolate reductase (NADPH)